MHLLQSSEMTEEYSGGHFLRIITKIQSGPYALRPEIIAEAIRGCMCISLDRD